MNLFLISFLVSFVFANVLKNPSFEQGSGTDVVGWRNEYNTCVIDTTVSHSGTQSLHCVDSSSTERGGIKQSLTNLETGVVYKLSAYIKLKNLQNGDMLIFSESLDSSEGIYGYAKSVEGCEHGNCDGDWFYLEAIGKTGFIQPSHTFGILFHNKEAVGEFWIDDVSMEIILADIISTIQVVSWRQEVFHNIVEVRIGVEVENTIFENGDYLSFKLEVIKKGTSIVVLSENEFEIKKLLRQRVAVMRFDPKNLEAGYYILNATCNNSYMEGKTETTQTTIRKLEKEPNYGTYVDNNLVTWKEGKKFFPLGLYLDEIIDSDLELLKDSPFNLIIGPGGMTASTIEHIYEATNKQVNVIRPVTKGVCVDLNKCTDQDFKDGLVVLKQLVDEFKNISGFFGYYPVDEPLSEYIERLKEATWIIRENDDQHVIYTAVNKNREVPTLKEGMDAFGMDVYPVQNEEPLYAVWLVAERGRKGVANGQGLWNIIQIFDWTVYEKLNEEPPTEEQMRQMTYQTIAGGSMGIIYYDLTDLHRMNNKTSFDKQWNSVKKIANELKDKYVDIIYSVEEKPNDKFIFPTQGNEIGTRIWKKDGDDYILIVNNKNVSLTYTFEKPTPEVVLEVLSGKSTIKHNGTEVYMEMPPMDVVWLKQENGTNKIKTFSILLLLLLMLI